MLEKRNKADPFTPLLVFVLFEQLIFEPHVEFVVPRAQVSFGQRQDTCLGADQKTRGLWERD